MKRSDALKTLGATAGVALVAGLGLYATRLHTVSTIRQESFSGTPYDLYSMDVTYHYDLDAIIATGLSEDQGNIDALLGAALPFLPVHMTAPNFNFGCTAFALTGDGGTLMGRNYDFKFDTSALLVHCAPSDGYESIGLCALDNLHANSPLESMKKRLACLAAPFVCLDGINEKGVSIAVLILDSIPTRQHRGKPAISTSMAIRLVLDRAATTQEAVDLLDSYDMYASAGRDHHFFICDASGDSRAIEYDCDSETREMHATPARQMTNFFVMHKDKVTQVGKNGRYGHGLDRYDAVVRLLDGAGQGDDERALAWEALKASSQEPNPYDITSNTQWSVVFDNTARTASITHRRRWDDVHRATIQGLSR